MEIDLLNILHKGSTKKKIVSLTTLGEISSHPHAFNGSSDVQSFVNLVVSTQHHYSAQIDFGMQEFKLFLFSHALLNIMCLVSTVNEIRENSRDNNFSM